VEKLLGFCVTFYTIAGLIPQSLLLEAHVTLANLSGVTSGKVEQNVMRVDQCLCSQNGEGASIGSPT